MAQAQETILEIDLDALQHNLEFIKSNVPNLVETEIISSAKCYHYTMHYDSIERTGR